MKRETEYAWCPSCGTWGAVKKDGTMRQHTRRARTRESRYATATCEGGKVVAPPPFRGKV